MVVHHSHGVPAGQETRHTAASTAPAGSGAASADSHNPYSRDGEGRKADGQDDPGGHWAGEELPLSHAWGDTGASDRRQDRRQRDRETGWVRGSLTPRETHWDGHERRHGEGQATTCLLRRTCETTEERLQISAEEQQTDQVRYPRKPEELLRNLTLYTMFVIGSKIKTAIMRRNNEHKKEWTTALTHRLWWGHQR